MKKNIISFFLWQLLLGAATAVNAQNHTGASLWLTKADRSVLFEKQKNELTFKPASGSNFTINVNDKQTYQPI